MRTTAQVKDKLNECEKHIQRLNKIIQENGEDFVTIPGDKWCPDITAGMQMQMQVSERSVLKWVLCINS